jgi:Tol biopolymer transport system component
VTSKFAAPNHLLFIRNNTLFRQTFDPNRLAVSGAEDAVAEQVQSFSTSNGGVLAYRTLVRTFFEKRQLTWFDRTGRVLGTVPLAELNPASVSLAPDSRRVATHGAGAGSSDVWLIDLERNVQTRFTFGIDVAGYPVWSPDGQSIVFVGRVGAGRLFEKSANGTSPERALINDMQIAGPSDWSRDRKFVLFRFRSQNSISNAADIWALPIQDGGKPFVWLDSPQSDEFHGTFSPNTRWVAHGSDESGLFQIFVHSFPKPSAKWQVSTAGGVEPRWRGDGKELYFISPDRTLMSVAVAESADGRSLEIGKPTPLFQTSIAFGFTNNSGFQYAVTPDGQRFLVNTSQDTKASSINVVVNWTEGLKRPARP